MAQLYLMYDDEFLEHIPPDYHPETPDRLKEFHKGILEEAKFTKVELRYISPKPASDELILGVHTQKILYTLKAIDGGSGYIDPDTYYSPKSARVARLAAGGGVELVRSLLQDGNPLGIALLRPPGHHATKDQMMGFCLLNNVAIAGNWAIENGLSKVAIYDFDLHHGNGTQDIFYTRDDVLYISTHQLGIYPGTGYPSERGVGSGEGFTVNLPMRAGDGDEEFLEVLNESIIPLLTDYRPELLLLSAGFDSMLGDPLGSLRLTSEGLGKLLLGLFSWAKSNRVPVGIFLEGGYNLGNLRKAGKTIIRVFKEVFV